MPVRGGPSARVAGHSRRSGRRRGRPDQRHARLQAESATRTPSPRGEAFSRPGRGPSLPVDRPHRGGIKSTRRGDPRRGPEPPAHGDRRPGRDNPFPAPRHDRTGAHGAQPARHGAGRQKRGPGRTHGPIVDRERLPRSAEREAAFSPGRPLVRREHLQLARVPRPRPPGRKQAPPGPDDQPRAADPQRVGNDRADPQALPQPPGGALPPAGRGRRHRQRVHRRDRRDRPFVRRRGAPAPLDPARVRRLHREGRGALEEPPPAPRRHRRLVRHGHLQLPHPLRLRDPGAAPHRLPDRLREGLLQAPPQVRHRGEDGRRRPRHRADRAARHQPLLSRAVGPPPAALGRVRRAPRASSSSSPSSPATGSRSGC